MYQGKNDKLLFFSSEVIICGMQLFVQSGVTIELLDMGSILLYACNLSLPNDNPSFPWANRQQKKEREKN